MPKILGAHFKQRKITWTVNGSWTCPVGVYRIHLEGTGAGGGGSSWIYNNGPSSPGGGGGGGAYISKWIDVIPGNTYNITIGAGGVGGNWGQHYSHPNHYGYGGTSGGSTFFGALELKGGQAPSPENGKIGFNPFYVSGGRSWGGTAGNTEQGLHGYTSISGGSGGFGDGAYGAAGSSYGAGGSGAISYAGNGYAGANGAIIVSWFGSSAVQSNGVEGN